MSPAYRQPPQPGEDDRSVWTTTGIYIALIILTLMMAFGIHSLSGRLSPEAPEVRPESRASRGP